jgi:amino acid adenylation domain-containing protein
VWFLNQHHLITDALGVAVLFRRLSSLYLATTGPAKEDTMTFPSFANHLKRISTANQVSLEHVESASGCGLYGERGKSTDTFAPRIGFVVEGQKLIRLKKLCGESEFRALTEDLSIYQFFATAVFAYLSRVSIDQSITIASPAGKRNSKADAITAGLFIEFFALSCEVSDKDTFLSVHKKVRDSIFSFLRNSANEVSIPTLNRDLNVVFNYLAPEFSDFAGIETESTWLHPEHIDRNHDLRIHCYREEERLSIYFEAKEMTFGTGAASRFVRDFEKVLDAFLENPNQIAATVPLVTQVPDNEQKIESTYPDLIESFQNQVSISSGNTAVEMGNDLQTYADVYKASIAFSLSIKKQGFKPGAKVGLFLERSPEFIISVLGCLIGGYTYVPIDVSTPHQRIEFVLRDSAAELVIVPSSESETFGLPGMTVEAALEANTEDSDFTVNSAANQAAYILYTSGSTGNPKGVIISRDALSNYVGWAAAEYAKEGAASMPFFTSIGFDLTVTSLFVPILTGGRIVVYPDTEGGSTDDSILRIPDNESINTIKLTPSHLSIFLESVQPTSNLKTFILGGEDFRSELAHRLLKLFPAAEVFNEYGPTEATVGCIVHQIMRDRNYGVSIPIGKPITNSTAIVLDDHQNIVPNGVVGNLFLGGKGLADGYTSVLVETENVFVQSPFHKDSLLYRSGDLARVNKEDEFEYLGRSDRQIKISGHRIEPGEIEAAITALPNIKNCAVVGTSAAPLAGSAENIEYCLKCGLPSNYPEARFNDEGVCRLCQRFQTYRKNAAAYFKSEEDLRSLLNAKTIETSRYDCLTLLSGGKDSTYVLARLVEMGYRVLAFTLDNGFISDQAKENIERVVGQLDVDHVYGSTPSMNDIFVDSLKRHSNVCNGCFKTIYTLSAQKALELDIPFIVTGLSRGQFFETRLTEELFVGSKNFVQIDKTILDARKEYHRVDDAVFRLLDTSAFKSGEVFERITFVDFYRYEDVTLDQLLAYLDERLPWIRPTDTGRSTNCLINKAGIAVHRKVHGFSNYAFPYSWDVRIGHKERDAAIDEVNEVIDKTEVTRILEEIGYHAEEPVAHLVAYFESDESISDQQIRASISKDLPDYMVPAAFVGVSKLPLTGNGKIDINALVNERSIPQTTKYVAPETDLEELVTEIWARVLNIPRIGIHDEFLVLGGQSLSAIRIVARLNKNLGMGMPVGIVFANPTIERLAQAIEAEMSSILEQQNSEDQTITSEK